MDQDIFVRVHRADHFRMLGGLLLEPGVHLDDLSLLLLDLAVGDLLKLLAIILQVLKLEFQPLHFFCLEG